MTKMNELYEKVAKDEALQAEVAEIMNGATTDNESEIRGKLVEFAKKQGYDVTTEEIAAFFGGMAQASQELSEAELDAVAGGKDENTSIKAGLSIIFLGLFCLGVSIVDAAEGNECMEAFVG